MKTLQQRFHEKVIPVTESGCWIWIGATCSGGYGQMKIARKKKLAHRMSWIVNRGDIPDGLDVLHRCDVTCCVNPDHLFLGNDSDNQRDSFSKGRAYFNRRNILRDRIPHFSKLTPDQVISIREKHGVTLKVLANEFGVSQSQISSIRSRRYWKHI